MSTISAGFFARGVVFVLTRPLHLFVGTEARGALLPATAGRTGERADACA